jgi:hypothetical protein
MRFIFIIIWFIGVVFTVLVYPAYSSFGSISLWLAIGVPLVLISTYGLLLGKLCPKSNTFKSLTIISLLLLVLSGGYLYFAIKSVHSGGTVFGQCQSGYVNYGLPLGCISKQEYLSCQRTVCPICLSAGTEIAADKGWKQVTILKPGDLVWSINTVGQKVLVPIIKVSKRAVPQGTQLLHISLQDGRSLLISPNHPTASGLPFKDIEVGDSLDHSKVISINLTIYKDGFTFDILPQSYSGDYWANGVLVGSTLK